MNKLSLFNLFLSPKKLLLLIGIAFVTITSTPLKASAADRLKFNLGILSFELSIDALELYAKEGKINRELNFYTSRLDERTVSQLRRVLRRKINVNPVLLYRLTRSPMIIELIESLGEVATTHHERNGFYALRGSITNAAIEQPDGVTLIDVLRQFPTDDISIDAARLFELRDELNALIEYREAIVKSVVQQAEQEIVNANKFLPLKDLRTPGGIAFIEKTIEIESRTADQNVGIRSREPFRVRLYLPKGLPEPVPVAILSHGFGSEPRSFDYLSKHLASHGIAAVAVEHIGSDSDYELEILEGAKKRTIASSEFIERPLDIHYVLDELERRNTSNWGMATIREFYSHIPLKPLFRVSFIN